MRAAAALALAGVVATGAARAACPLAPGTGPVVAGDGVQLAWTAEPRTIVAGRPFALVVDVCPAGARLVRVDATMPEHGHGMNYRASLHPEPSGRWRAQGLLWHMSGRWELAFEIESEGLRQVLRQSVVLP